jgi:hypothetical protein
MILCLRRSTRPCGVVLKCSAQDAVGTKVENIAFRMSRP